MPAVAAAQPQEANAALHESIELVLDELRQVGPGGGFGLGEEGGGVLTREKLLVGGTSPFGLRKAMPVFVEAGVLDLPRIFINGGRRGYLVGLAPEVLVALLGAKAVRCALEA